MPTKASPAREYYFPLIRPAVPKPEQWFPFLQESYQSGHFSNFGPVASRLEHGLRETFGVPGDGFVLTASATAALAACLIASDISGPVMVPAFTFPATFAAVRMAGCEPIVFDVDPATWSADEDRLEKSLQKTGARAAVLVAPFGITQNFLTHVARCATREVTVVIDNAAGLGGGSPDRRSSRGDANEVYSLHATKPFAVGEGGAIHTDLRRISGLRSAINFGLPWEPNARPRWGINGKMPEVTAAIGLAALSHYSEALRVRQMQAARYCELFDWFDAVRIHRGIMDAPWQVFPCLLPEGDIAAAFVQAAKRRGLQVRQYYQPSLADWGGLTMADDCRAARDLARRMVCLPVYSQITEAELEAMHAIVRAALVDCLRTRG